MTVAAIAIQKTQIKTQGKVGFIILLMILLPCVLTLPWALTRYDQQIFGQIGEPPMRSPSWSEPMGADGLGRNLLWRCLLGGTISLGIGACAAVISVGIGVLWGAIAGYCEGRVDAVMMRFVDVLYGLPYVLLVVLLDIAFKPMFDHLFGFILSEAMAHALANVVTLFLAIGSISWLTLARVIRGQVLSLRRQPFIEAAHASGIGMGRIFVYHLLPNLVGPIVVYTTLTVPTAILQESFLSFLGIGIQAPLPSWGNLASQGVRELSAIGLPGATVHWWLIVWPCTLLGLTLMALNFIGDELRDRLDPRSKNK